METTALGTRLYAGIMDECAAPMHKYLYFTILLETDRKPLFKPNGREQHSHAEYTDSDPRCLTVAKNHQIAFLIHKVPRPLPTSPPTSNPNNGVSYILKSWCPVLHKHLTKLNSSQGPPELMKSPFMRDGVTLGVKNSSIYVLQWEERSGTTTHWNSDHVSLSRAIKFKGPTKLYTYKAFQ